MKKVTGFTLIVSCLVIIIISFTVGYFVIGGRVTEKPNDGSIGPDIDNQNISDNEESGNGYESTVEPEAELIGPNTIIEIITYYKECGHHISEVKKADKEMINMNKEEFEFYIKKMDSNYQLALFSHERVIIKREKEHLCPNHYVIGVKDNKITIFKINSDGVKEVYKTIDIEITMLKKIDQEKLKKGIVIDSEDDIGNVIENFIS